MRWPRENASKPLSVNPFRVSQAVGGVMALQGFFRSLPIIYGAHGCVDAVGELLSRHYREPVALQNVTVQDSNLIFGGSESAQDALELAISSFQPELIVLIGTSLTEMVGEDLENDVKRFVEKCGQSARGSLILSLYMPDYEGSLETGFARMTERIVEAVTERTGGTARKKRRNRINLLAGPHLTPGDVMELKEIISSFGLEVITLPDLSSSLCGHLLIGSSKLSRGGVPLDYLDKMMTSSITIAVGGCMEGAARSIERSSGIPYRVFPSLIGLQASDDFFDFLRKQSRTEVQVKYRWQRQILLDAMLDAQAAYRGKRIIAALEPDHLLGLSEWLGEIGVESFQAVAPCASPVLESIKGGALIGDLEDLERLAAGGADLWIGSSYGEQGALRSGIAFEPMGFPVLGRLGTPLKISVGYRGTTELLGRIGNALLDAERSVRK
ncbi:nitrogenase iron-molybdenum cofactor biosynthesis protein NifN [Paenibacillus sp. 7124]|uniref:Nitrogenase iron-molybdenum cofactor biosynthesis protein NifN n=1 Tax=Paenibacillus apii TaxID=1850370 RepID=A0A6M1PMG0_9BACL|nr:nitrogenase iron-molybdenum cofactor biosynthesis protein NifN [Paenibacillus apii]NGM83512.1 nitrogenase iron-molybdenum cofactor biosynthesis protein NifN [Paenibacillus apii]NJJ40466.1 nitrogenase iron-molybdenum cofactor biosynthesis protein NifN [Paenibacillus apii]